jgi:hypothetical protein
MRTVDELAESDGVVSVLDLTPDDAAEILKWH